MDRRLSLNERIVKAAQSSHLIVSRAQLLAIGCSERQIDYRLRRGLLWRTFVGAYSVGAPPRTWRAIWQAAVVSAGPGSVLSGQAAAALWGITDRRNRRVDVNRAGGRNRSEQTPPASGWKIDLNVWTRNLPEQVSLVDRIPVLPVPELLVDLAGRLPSIQLEAMVSGASQKGHLDQSVVAQILKQGKGQKGIAALRHHLRFWDPEMRKVLSVRESRFIVVTEWPSNAITIEPHD